MADSWNKKYSTSKVPDGIVLTVQETTVSDGASVEIQFDWRPGWIQIVNLDENDLVYYFSQAAKTAGKGGWKVKGGAADTLTDTASVRRLIIEAPSGDGDVTFQARYLATRSEFNPNHPELTIANDFPAYSAGPPVKPGVG